MTTRTQNKKRGRNAYNFKEHNERTVALREQRAREQGNLCWWCDKETAPHKQTLEHLLPVTRKKLAHCPYNVVMACDTCNRRRGNKTMRSGYQTGKFKNTPFGVAEAQFHRNLWHRLNLQNSGIDVSKISVIEYLKFTFAKKAKNDSSIQKERPRENWHDTRGIR